METTTDLDKIVTLNDAFRRDFSSDDVILSRGIQALCPEADREDLFDAIRCSDSTQLDDAFGERSCGTVGYDGAPVAWRIEYYNPTGDDESSDPADETVTRRMMTMIIADTF